MHSFFYFFLAVIYPRRFFPASHGNTGMEVEKLKKGLFVLSFLLIMLSLNINSVQAANWVLVGDSNATTVYVDGDSVIDGPSGSKEAWTKTEFKSPDCTSDYPKALRKCSTRVVVYEKHFKDKTFCPVQAVFYFADGSSQGYTDDCRPKRVVPDTVPEAVWKYVFKPPAIDPSPQIHPLEP